LTALAEGIDRLTTAIGSAVAWLALVIVVLQFALVLARYVFGFGSIWLAETVIYCHAALIMLAAAWTLRSGGHVRVDVFYDQATPRTHAGICRSHWCCSGSRCLTLRDPGRSSSVRTSRAACRWSFCSRR
jgi:TRAP-type mannitol/chloroaromatic compound transport system permease small subunit